MQKSSFIQSGKKTREELYLPPLRFVATDNWVDVLGHDAFIAWLKFHTWVDRRDENRKNDRIPCSLEDVWDRLGVKKTKFYEKILRPLWEYGLIDIIEYEESQRKSQKPKNIIVYTSPANSHETETKPLVKLRDWKKDYGSISQFYGNKGGRPKKVDENTPNVQIDNPSTENHGSQTQTVDGSQTRTVTVRKQKPNNVSNALTNSSNASTNASNNNNHHQEAWKEQKTVVVDKNQIQQTQSHIRYLFGNELPEKQVIRLLNICMEERKDPGDVVQATYTFFAKKQEHVTDLTAALIYGAKKGWQESIRVQAKPILDQKEKEFSIYNWVNPTENNKARTEPEVSDSSLQVLQECVEYYQQSLMEHVARKEEMYPDQWENTRKQLELELKAAQDDLMLEKERIQAVAK